MRPLDLGWAVGIVLMTSVHTRPHALRAAPQVSPCPGAPEATPLLGEPSGPGSPSAAEGVDSLQFAIDAGRALDDRDARKCWYEVAERIARLEAQEAPQDPEAQYRLALALGLRADEEGGRTRVGIADELYRQLQVVLEMEPDHPEAQHIFGRLHAGVMRMNRVTRFLATRILGGEALRDASWERAEALLVFAEQARPEIPDYHYELGRLYEDTDRPELAAQEARHTMDLVPQDPGAESVQRRAGELLTRVEEDGGR